MRKSSLSLVAALGAACLFAVPAFADILVMQDGSRVETDGPWEVKGRQVIFTQPNGTLSAVRLSEVDLDASHVATEQSEAAPAEAEAKAEADAKEAAREKQPVLVLTNKDIGRGQVDAPDAGEDEDSDSGEGGKVEVADWSYSPAGDDPVYELTGRLENRSGQVAENIQLFVDFIAVDGGEAKPDVHFLRQADVDTQRLEPGETSDFSYRISRRDLEFTGVPGQQFESPRVVFDVQYRQADGGRDSGVSSGDLEGEVSDVDDRDETEETDEDDEEGDVLP